MIERDESQYIQKATATLKKHTGKAPAGWLSPWISESHVTLDLLQVITLKSAYEHRETYVQQHAIRSAQQIPHTAFSNVTVVMQKLMAIPVFT